MIEFYKRFSEIQKSLKVSKENDNTFAKYKFRNASDILQKVKPLLQEDEFIICDQAIILIKDATYVQTVAFFCKNEHKVSATAFAREDETKKGMDNPQITGSASTYSKKYALQNLFSIDDSKDDPDSTEKNDTYDFDQYKHQLLECKNIEKVKEVYTKIYANRTIFTSTQLDELTKIKDNLKTELTNNI